MSSPTAGVHHLKQFVDRKQIEEPGVPDIPLQPSLPASEPLRDLPADAGVVSRDVRQPDLSVGNKRGPMGL
jgi:hypothetical protein